MTLDDFILINAGVDFQVVDVLGEVRQKLSLVLEEPNKLVSRRVSLFRWKYVLGNGVEYRWVFAE